MNTTTPFSEPIYDDTKPIACTITTAELSGHIERIERLRTNMISIARTSFGVLIQFPASKALADDVRRFAIEEKQCCQFWGFDLTEGPTLALRWDGPPQTSTFMDHLVSYFEGREPIGTLFGSL